MYPPAWQTAAAAHVIDASATLYSRRGLFASPTPFINTISTIEDVQARYGAHFDRAMRIPAEAVSDVSDILRPRLPRRGLSPFVGRLWRCGTWAVAATSTFVQFLACPPRGSTGSYGK